MENKNFVLIGGGELGRPGYPYETYELDKTVYELAKHNTVLFVGLAQVTSGEDHIIKYYNCIKNIYENNFGCKVINFDCYNFVNNLKETKQQIKNAGIIYFGGGDTHYLVSTLKKYGLDKDIIKACQNGTVLAGLSAGANLMGKYGLSLVNYLKYQEKQPVSIDGLDLISAVIVPHFINSQIRQDQLKEYLKENNTYVGIGIDNGCALVVSEDKCKTVESLPNASIHICKWENNKYIQKDITIKEYIKVADLLK